MVPQFPLTTTCGQGRIDVHHSQNQYVSGIYYFGNYLPLFLSVVHEVFDTGGDLHGLLIAESIDELLKNWSKVLFVDIYVIGVRPRR